MKKIALVLAAILVIGIQGCSTDDKPEQLGDTVPENFILAGSNIEGKMQVTAGTCFKKIFVVYPSGSTPADNAEYAESSSGIKGEFSFVMYSINPYCDDVYEWYVPCNELPSYICTQNGQIRPTTDSDGTVTHTASNPRLNIDDDNDDPQHPCSQYINFGWTTTSPSCEQIKNSFM